MKRLELDQILTTGDIFKAVKPFSNDFDKIFLVTDVIGAGYGIIELKKKNATPFGVYPCGMGEIEKLATLPPRYLQETKSEKEISIYVSLHLANLMQATALGIEVKGGSELYVDVTHPKNHSVRFELRKNESSIVPTFLEGLSKELLHEEGRSLNIRGKKHSLVLYDGNKPYFKGISTANTACTSLFQEINKRYRNLLK